MTLEEKIRTIDKPSIADIPNVGLLPDGKADTIKEFFDTFVEKRLPDEKVVRAWHKLLMDYTDDLSNVSCCVRFGNQRGPVGGTRWGEVGDDALRRGWLTKNHADGFEYFFTDNHFCTYICKMALCGFVPSLREFSDMFHAHKFPYGFMHYLRNHPEVDGAVIEFGKNPGFSSNYKISHVFDSGANFLVNGKILNDAELSTVFYPLGNRTEFLANSDHIRTTNITNEAKQVIVAKFLRFAHPFNYFLTPAIRPKLHTYDPAAEVKNNDIGEDNRLLYYVRNYLKKKYPDIYREFLERILWPYDPEIIYPDTGNEFIGMDYGPHINPDDSSQKYGHDEELAVAAYYLRNHVSLTKVEEQVLKVTGKLGFDSRRILNDLGIDTSRHSSYKGLLINATIDDEISRATGTFKTTLEEIKKRGL